MPWNVEGWRVLGRKHRAHVLPGVCICSLLFVPYTAGVAVGKGWTLEGFRETSSMYAQLKLRNPQTSVWIRLNEIDTSCPPVIQQLTKNEEHAFRTRPTNVLMKVRPSLGKLRVRPTWRSKETERGRRTSVKRRKAILRKRMRNKRRKECTRCVVVYVVIGNCSQGTQAIGTRQVELSSCVVCKR